MNTLFRADQELTMGLTGCCCFRRITKANKQTKGAGSSSPPPLHPPSSPINCGAHFLGGGGGHQPTSLIDGPDWKLDVHISILNVHPKF
jgi:hypothetical protein